MTPGPGWVDPQDWVTIWQSEWAAMAVDRELQEGLLVAAEALSAALAAGPDRPAGRPGADAAAGAAAAGATFGDGFGIRPDAA